MGVLELDELARRQHGLISLEQLRTQGFNDRAVRWRREKGELVRVHQGIFRCRGAPPSWDQRALAALMAAGPDSALSHRTAGGLLGLDGMPLTPHLELTVPEGRHVTTPGVRVHRTREALPVFKVRGLRVTALARTLVDLAAVLPEPELEFALDCAQRKNRSLLRWLEAYVANIKQPCRPGLGVLMRLLEQRRDGAMDSIFEVRMKRALARHGFPPFTKRFIVLDRGQYVMRLDFAWPELLVALHADSYLWHHQRERMARDAHQRSILNVLKWRYVTVMYSMIDAGLWVEQLRTILAQRTELLQRARSQGRTLQAFL